MRLGSSWQRVMDASIYRKKRKKRKRRDISGLTAAERGRYAGSYVGKYRIDRSPKSNPVRPKRDRIVYEKLI